MDPVDTPHAKRQAKPQANADDVLAQWRARSAEVCLRLGAPGVARPDQVAGLTGMQVFERIFSGALPRIPIGETLDFIPVEIEFGRAVFQGEPLARHYNPLGTVHGGWIATLLDSCVGCAVHSTLPAGKGYTTVELRINYVRAVTDKLALVRAEGKVIHVGGRLATAEGRLTGPDGKLYAHASTTCFVFETPLTERH